MPMGRVCCKPRPAFARASQHIDRHLGRGTSRRP
jgi:hypothetical protein